MTYDEPQRQVCPTCGLAFTDERAHRDWHVDRRLHMAAFNRQMDALAEYTPPQLANRDRASVREGEAGRG